MAPAVMSVYVTPLTGTVEGATIVVTPLALSVPLTAIRSFTPPPTVPSVPKSKRILPPFCSVSPLLIVSVAAVPSPAGLSVPLLTTEPSTSVAKPAVRPAISVCVAPSARPPDLAETSSNAPELTWITLLPEMLPVADSASVPEVM